MPHEKRLADGDVFQTHSTPILFELDNPVHEEKWIAMRKIGLDFQAIHEEG
jgi:hypothetical protein